jgi:hypothetical protein
MSLVAACIASAVSAESRESYDGPMQSIEIDPELKRLALAEAAEVVLEYFSFRARPMFVRGGTYRFVFSHAAPEQPMAFFGRYIEMTPHSRIVWMNEESRDGAVSTVTFEERATRRYWSCTNSIPQSKPSTRQSPLEAQAGQASSSSSWTHFSPPW